MEKKETIGSVSLQLSEKSLETNSAIEQMQEQLSEYDKSLFECIENSKNKYPGTFYVVVITKRERLMPNVFRQYFFSRHTCPSPDWDQAVYRWSKGDKIDFLWVIPAKTTCEEMLLNKSLVPEDQRHLMMSVQSLYDGSLLRAAKKLNNEKEEYELRN
jgi:hypothetical protein